MEERQRLEFLIALKFLTTEQLEELEENPLVLECNYLGYSADYPNYYWYDIHICQEGCLPSDHDCLTENHNIYVEKVD